MRSMSPHNRGFTLIEVLIIAPFAILLIAAMIAMATQATNSAMRSYGRIRLQTEVLRALDMIEQDVKVSSHLSSLFTNQINMDGLATNVNPMNPAKKLIDKSTCALVDSVTNPEDATVYQIIYFVDINNDTLYRRIDFNGKWCGGSQATQGDIAWQKHLDMQSVIKDATVSLSVTNYDKLPGDDSHSADGLTATISATRMVAGQEISYTGQIRVKSVNI